MPTPRTLLSAFLLLPAVLFADPAGDRRIEETVKSSYTFRRVLNNDIDVRVREGVATLTGRVRDLDQSRLAEDTIANIEGVRRVENNIKVDPKAGGTSDEWLAVKIRSKLLLNRDISLLHTRVDVKDGVVTLTGTADSEPQKVRTEFAVKEIVGVRQVKNLLEVSSRTADARGRTGDRSPDPDLPAGAGLPTGRASVPHPGQALRSAAEDTSITTQVKQQLLTHEETSGLKASVEAKGGTIVITGEAENSVQKDLVTVLARRVQGVSHVENRMSVKRP